MSDKAASHISIAVIVLAVAYVVTHRYAAVRSGDNTLGIVDTFTGQPCFANGTGWVCPTK